MEPFEVSNMSLSMSVKGAAICYGTCYIRKPDQFSFAVSWFLNRQNVMDLHLENLHLHGTENRLRHAEFITEHSVAIEREIRMRVHEMWTARLPKIMVDNVS